MVLTTQVEAGTEDSRAGHPLMQFQTLLPSPALSIVQFSDIDAFRPVEFVAEARSVPLNLANFHTARAAVQLPFCQITVLNSFPRILDVSYRAAHGLVMFQLEDRYEVSVNGMSVNRPAFIGLRGNLDLQFVEPRGSLHAIVTLGAGLQDREWFERPDELCPFTPDAGALATVRSVTAEILCTASLAPDLLQDTGSAFALQESLLLAIDEMFRRSRPPEVAGRLASRGYCRLVRMIDDYVAFHPAAAIYSADLAAQCGVSVRTLGTAVAAVRGMSLHRYLRLKQLWSARAQLVKGSDTITVTSCARANGFHHMGEFSRLYRATFDETASSTLARARAG
jgi:AraC family ethanolamine operon transcriptional activator